MNVGFCGHRDLENKDDIETKLYYTIENLINYGASSFYIGNYGNFDYLAAKTVKKLKNKYPHIKSINIIPYIDTKTNYDLFDYSEYPSLETTPKRLAIIKANEYLVNKCEVIVAYIRNKHGGAYTTYNYAKKKMKKVIEI